MLCQYPFAPSNLALAVILLGLTACTGSADDIPEIPSPENVPALNPVTYLNPAELKAKQAAADAGDTKAMIDLGNHYRDMAADDEFEPAIAWYQKAIDAGDPEGLLSMGSMIRDGYGVKQNYAKSVELYKQAIEDGCVGAKTALGWAYYHGYGVKQDYKMTAKLYQEAADAGNPEALHNLGYLYYQGNGVEKDTAKAIEYFRKASAAGNPYADFFLGGLYFKGEGVEKDLEKAKSHFAAAAKQYHVPAIIDLAKLEISSGSPEGKRTGFVWLLKGRRDPEVMKLIGDCYFGGIGTSLDAKQGEAWYQKAMDAGNEHAAVVLANRLIKGHGLELDAKRGLEILDAEASKGNPYARTELGFKCLDAGIFDKALGYFSAAADQGEPGAMVGLWKLYYDGLGVDKDHNKAMLWLKLAAKQGHPAAISIQQALKAQADTTPEKP